MSRPPCHLRAAGGFGLALVMSVTASAASCQSPAGSGVMEGNGYRVVPVVEGISNPWSIAFLPGGDMLVTEKQGRLRVVRGGVLEPEAVQGVPAVRTNGQGGLLDVVVHPDFSNNQLVYLSFSKPNAQGNQATTAVVRGRLQGNALTGVEEIFEAQAWSGGGNHFGSRLAFDAQGFLFITIGDRGASPAGNVEAHPSQDLSNHQGTIVRLHDDGRVPADNPFVGRSGVRPETWSYGHRNPQGLAIDPTTGDIWMTEHGPRGGDELNLVRPGLNYGWPVIGYGINYNGATIHVDTHREGMEQPAHYWVPSIATSGLMIYTGERFPEWRGNLFVGGLAGQQIARLVMDGHRVVSEETIVAGQGRIRDIRQGPDGHIYLAIDAGDGPTIRRLEPTGH